MSEKMTLDQVRDLLRFSASENVNMDELRDKLADAIDAHLATLPAAVPDAMEFDASINWTNPDCRESYVEGWNACREAMLTQRGNAQDAVALFIGQRVMWEDNLGRSHPATIVDSHPETYDARLDDGTYANGYSRKRFAIDAHLASLPAATPGDIVERLRTAARALVRERVVYAEDVEALADVAKLLEAMLTQRGDAQDARDVARYRWLRANAYECDERLSFNNMYLECADGKLLLDKSIDAAMLASGEG